MLQGNCFAEQDDKRMENKMKEWKQIYQSDIQDNWRFKGDLELDLSLMKPISQKHFLPLPEGHKEAWGDAKK